MTPVAERPRRTYRPGLAYEPRPGSGFEPDTRPPAMFTPDPAEHLGQVRWARDVLGWRGWELDARFTRPDTKETR